MLRAGLHLICIAVVSVGFCLRAACAEVTTDQPGAILVFPKIVSNDTQDTTIQITNATGFRIFARCFFIDASPDPITQEPTWLVTDFQTTLTRLQPTVWVAGQGLPAVPIDGRPDDLYPGPIPPVNVGFIGELRCIVVDESERPIARNALIGEATITTRASGATRKYRAIAVPGLPGNNGDNTLLLNDVEYSTCPRAILFNHFFDDAPDPITDTPLHSRLIVVPCSLDIASAEPGSSRLSIEVFNEFEQKLSTALAVVCFEDIELSKIDNATSPELSVFNFATHGSVVGHSRSRAAIDADTDHGHGVFVIAEERREDNIAEALNVHFLGGNLQSDLMILPDPF
jgi:hypothetical protein